MDKKSQQLGINFSTASHRLKKKILFSLIKRLGENFCFKCGQEILEGELSIEHKENWLDVSPDLFWNLENIAYSHLKCNKRTFKETKIIHGKHSSYTHRGCRCEKCKNAHKEHNYKYRAGC